MMKPMHTISEQDWKDHFTESLQHQVQYFKAMQNRMAELAMNVEILNAASRVSQVMAKMDQILEGLCMYWHIKVHPARMVKFLITAI